jgi:hypothetical protein
MEADENRWADDKDEKIKLPSSAKPLLALVEKLNNKKRTKYEHEQMVKGRAKYLDSMFLPTLTISKFFTEVFGATKGGKGNRLKEVLGKRYTQFQMNKGNGVAISAKALHSAVNSGWLNLIQYWGPSDRAGHSFLKLYPEFVEPLFDAYATDYGANTPHGRVHRGAPGKLGTLNDTLARYAEISKMKINPENPPQYELPMLTLVRPLNVCPMASPQCRAGCLNTSGNGGMNRPDITEAQRKAMGWAKPAELSKKQKAELGYLGKDGWTITDDYCYGFLRSGANPGGFYATGFNSIQSARLKRTHTYWIASATDGSAFQNWWVDFQFWTCISVKREVDRLGWDMPIAYRWNGTADVHAHRMRLKDGRYLYDALAEFGIIGYDYTKDYPKMLSWLKAKSWQGKEPVLAGDGTGVVGGFPKNYHLTFSWSERNKPQVVQVLKRGGQVAMVFRRSLNAKDLHQRGTGRNKRFLTTDALLKKSLAYLEAKGEKISYHQLESIFKMGGQELPERIDISKLTGGSSPAWFPVVPADTDDLRFKDEWPGKGKGVGAICALVAKADSLMDYEPIGRKNWFKRFVLALDKKGRITQNPTQDCPEGQNNVAVNVVDIGLIPLLVQKQGEWDILPTGFGC